MGGALVHALVRRGDQAIVLTRGRSRDHAHACAACGPGGRVSLETWTPAEPGAWMSLVDGVDAVVHLAGASMANKRWTTERKALLRSSRITSTELLTEAIRAAKKPPSVFITASAIGVYGTKMGDALVTEETPPGEDFLATLTKDWEDRARPAIDAGVRVCHPRLGLVLGRGGGLFGKLSPLFRAYLGGPLGDGKQYLPWVHLRDVANALEAMLDRSDLEGPYNVVAPEPATMDEFARSLGDALRRPSALRIPAFAVKLAMGAGAAEAMLTGQRAIPKRLTDAGFAFLFADLRSAFADLVDGVPDEMVNGPEIAV